MTKWEALWLSVKSTWLWCLRLQVWIPLWLTGKLFTVHQEVKGYLTVIVKGLWLRKERIEHPASPFIWAASWENRIFAYAKTKTQISFAVTAKLISAFVFATRIVQSLYFLNTKFQASSLLLWLFSPVGVEPRRKPRRPVFSQRGSYAVDKDTMRL